MTSRKLKFTHFFTLLTIIFCAQCIVTVNIDSAPQDNVDAQIGSWGIDPGQLGPKQWSAHWIWRQKEPLEANMLLLFRKSFTLDALPSSTRLFITADTRYNLFINGQAVNQGPARCAPHYQSFDILDVSAHLKTGKNTFALRVWHSGLARSWHQPPRPGLLAQLEMKTVSSTRIITTDNTWKVREEEAWDPQSPPVNHWIDGRSDIFDFRKAQRGWNTTDFDDSQWETAAAAMRNSGWPKVQKDDKPQAVTPPWVSLLPRDIPYLVEKPIKAVELMQCGLIEDSNIATMSADGPASYRFTDLPLLKLPRIGSDGKAADCLSGNESYQNGNGPLVISGDAFINKGTSFYALFDVQEYFNGRPQLEIKGPAGTIVDIMCAPYMLNDKFTPAIVGSVGADRIVLSGKRDIWEAVTFKPARYLALSVRNAGGPVEIYHAGVQQTAYPFGNMGSLKTPDDTKLEQIWEAGAKTIRAITTDAYTDNYRERRQYSQTSWFAARGNYMAFGDQYLQRRYLVQIAQEQEPNGILPSYAPLTGDDYMVILESGLFWLMSLRDYLLYSGDEATTRQLIPAAERAINRYIEMTNEVGLIDNPPYAYWLDHANMDRRGASFVLNNLYLTALEYYAETLDWLHMDGAAFAQRADALRLTLREKFWSPERRLFADALVDGKISNRYSEHNAGIALMTGVASPEQTPPLVAELINRNSSDVTEAVSLTYYSMEGLFRAGHAQDALSMMKDRFDEMLNFGNGTLWEEWWLDGTMRTGTLRPHSRSDAQGENAFPSYNLSRWILGVNPIKPGMREIELSHTPCGLKSYSGAVPTPAGVMGVTWKMETGGGSLVTDIPRGITVKLDIESLEIPTPTLTLDGQPTNNADIQGKYFVLPAGQHRLEFR
jgi:alpha-L-rhamnosidase